MEQCQFLSVIAVPQAVITTYIACETVHFYDVVQCTELKIHMETVHYQFVPCAGVENAQN